jgi:hypothetical protein
MRGSPCDRRRILSGVCTYPGPALVLKERVSFRIMGSFSGSQRVHTNARVSNGRQGHLDGPFNSVDWTNAAALNGAIANVGPAKVGVAAATDASGPEGEVTPGRSGWAIYGLPTGQPADHCASLCGYGLLPELVGLFERHRVKSTIYRACPRDFATRCSPGAPLGSSTGNR